MRVEVTLPPKEKSSASEKSGSPKTTKATKVSENKKSNAKNNEESNAKNNEESNAQNNEGSNAQSILLAEPKEPQPVQDVFFGISAVGSNGFLFSKAVQYGEEIALKVPVGDVQFALRLISLLPDENVDTSVGGTAVAGTTLADTVCSSGSPSVQVSDATWSGGIVAGDNTVPLALKASLKTTFVPLAVQVKGPSKKGLEKLKVQVFDGLTRQPLLDPCAAEKSPPTTDSNGVALSTLPDLGNSFAVEVLLTAGTESRRLNAVAEKVTGVGYAIVVALSNATTLEGSVASAAVNLDIDNGISDVADVKAGRSPLSSKVSAKVLSKSVSLFATTATTATTATGRNAVCGVRGLNASTRALATPKLLMRSASLEKEVSLSMLGNKGLTLLENLRGANDWKCIFRLSTFEASVAYALPAEMLLCASPFEPTSSPLAEGTVIKSFPNSSLAGGLTCASQEVTSTCTAGAFQPAASSFNTCKSDTEGGRCRWRRLKFCYF